MKENFRVERLQQGLLLFSVMPADTASLFLIK